MTHTQMTTTQSCINTLSILSRGIARDRFMDDLLALILTVTTHVTHIRKCTLWLWDPDTQHLCLKACHGIDKTLIRNRTLGLTQGIAGLVATRKKPLIVHDVTRHPRFREKAMARQSGLASMLGLPMFDQKNAVIGVLNCFTSLPHHFLESEIDLLGSVARQAAKAIENTEAMVKTVLAKEELAFQHSLGQATRVLMQRRHLDIQTATALIHHWSREASIPVHRITEAILLSD